MRTGCEARVVYETRWVEAGTGATPHPAIFSLAPGKRQIQPWSSQSEGPHPSHRLTEALSPSVTHATEGQEHTDKNIRHAEDPADKLRAPHFDKGPIDWMSIKASGGPTHRLRITPYWGSPRRTKGPTDPLSIWATEDHIFWWGPHALTSEGPQIYFTSRPLRAPHFDSELRLTEGPGPCIPTDEDPTDPLSIQATKVPHSYRPRASPYRGPHTPTDEGPHRLTAHLGLWVPHILTEPPSEL